MQKFIDSVHDNTAGAEPDKITFGSGLVVEGRNLTGAALALSYTDGEDGKEKTHEFSPEEYGEQEGSLVAPGVFWADLTPDTTKPATVTVTTDEGTDSRTVTFRES